MLDFLKKIFSKKPAPDAADVEKLRIEFKERYHSFKLLLGANNKTLEIMAEMEQALQGKHPFGMTFVRARCTAASVNVFRMIRKLEKLAPGKYKELVSKFDAAEQNVRLLLARKRVAEDERLIIPLHLTDKEMADLTGSKMANLGEIKNRIHLNVPDGFVITSHACQKFMEHNDLQAEIDRRFQSADGDDMERLYTLSSDIQQLIIRSEVPKAIEDAIMDAWKQLEAEKGTEMRMALRSSALGEDSTDSSFAGQYRSVLNVSTENVFEAYKDILASKYGLPATTYRLNRGFRDEDISMCVGCLVMIDAVAGGVVYSRNPVDISDDSIFINAAWGLPKSVVDGSADCDLFVVARPVTQEIQNILPDTSSPTNLSPMFSPIKNVGNRFVGEDVGDKCREPAYSLQLTASSLQLESPVSSFKFQVSNRHVIHKDIKDKKKKFVCYPEEGVCRIDLTEDDNRLLPSLNYDQSLILAELAVQLEEYYGSPQDIEWAIDHDGAVFLLQCRPLQQMEKVNQVSGIELRVSDFIVRGGVTASPGAACGAVYLADKGIDILQFPEGGVLVIRQALPKWASLLNRAAALVTEEGGFAGHLANVAREFGVPALFGLKGVTDKVSDGDLVTVDASGLTIYEGRIESLLTDSRKENNFMEGSPVYETLKQVSRHIVPLNLLDPDSPDFRPENCRTFHDITRFIHEKSVQEMFSFGRAHDFSERSGKQLYYRVPMQWWVLNLDDGFKQEVDGKYVRLEDIASVPMLALWDGIVAVPWEGPPPIDGRGFASVMFQATANTALTTGVRSKYSEQNYFMISKNYCSLNSRLGFHFSVTEALVSERAGENYVSFQFKGGAADFQRRLGRVRFIGDMLKDHGFMTEVTEDTLIARTKGHEAAFMKERLRIIGYLSIHTRQIDMIMSNPSRVNYYRSKFENDIRQFLIAKSLPASKYLFWSG